MADLEIDDVQFLTEDGRVSSSGLDKRAVYEPSRSQRVRQVVCSQQKTVCIVSLVAAVILCIAAIAAFARPGSYPCLMPLNKNESTSKSSSEIEGQEHIVTETFPWENIRLPPFITPIQYDIFLHPNLTTFYFEGTVHIHFRVTQSTEFIVLHSEHLNITKHELVNEEFNPKYLIKKTQYNKKFEQYIITFSPSLKISSGYYIKLGFQGILSDKLEGFYRSIYKTKSGSTRYLATTHFEPTYARTAFPCFDEPAMKAKFKMSIVREPNKHISLFNTKKINTKPFEHTLVVDEFEESVQMSTYLVAFVITDFKYISSESTRSKILVSVYAAEDRINLANFALNISIRILDFYENFFEINYPLSKLDLIAIPDFGAGAMENWGLITFRENSLLVDPIEASPSSLQWVTAVISHELAHQWFGNLVTMKWWNDLWLNEGFASFLENLAGAYVHPEWKMLEQFTVDVTQAALSLDSLVNSHPISEEVNDPSEIESIFDDISYRKGAAVLAMLNGFLGQDNLRTGLTAFLNKYKYKNAQTEDLWNTFSEVSIKRTDIDVKTVMDSWTRQKGYPLITITQNGYTIHASQRPFILSPTTDDLSVEEYKKQLSSTWHIPLTYTYMLNNSDTPQKKLIWLSKANKNFTIPGNILWFKANNDQGGFYRVTYDENNWTNLTRAIFSKPQTFSSADRSNLLDDTFTLSLARKLNITKFLEMTRYLSFERDYLPWNSALNGFNKMHILLRESASQVLLSKYVLSLLKPALDDLGWDSKGSHLDRKLRIELLTEGCKFGEQQTINEAKSRFEKFKKNEQINKDLRRMVYSVGVQYGTPADWEYVWKEYNSSVIPVEKRNLMSALSKTTDPWRISQLLEYSLMEDKIRTQDTPILLGEMAQNPTGHFLTWRFIQRNWNKLVEKFGSGSFSLDNIISQSTQDFSTEFDYNQMKSFFEVTKVGSGMRAVKQSLEKILTNMEWLRTYEKDVLHWLHTTLYDMPTK